MALYCQGNSCETSCDFSFMKNAILELTLVILEMNHVDGQTDFASSYIHFMQALYRIICASDPKYIWLLE